MFGLSVARPRSGASSRMPPIMPVRAELRLPYQWLAWTCAPLALGLGAAQQVSRMQQVRVGAQLTGGPRVADHAALHHVGGARQAERQGRELLDEQHADA